MVQEMYVIVYMPDAYEYTTSTQHVVYTIYSIVHDSELLARTNLCAD